MTDLLCSHCILGVYLSYLISYEAVSLLYNSVMKIHVDNLNSRIETDNPELLKALYELYSFNVPGARYSPAYKRRQWDGKTHFLTKSGVFKTGLLSRLLADLKKIDCTPEIIQDIWMPDLEHSDYDHPWIYLL